jgi:glycine/D-amino acid oxidase-like deaminating enzyme
MVGRSRIGLFMSGSQPTLRRGRSLWLERIARANRRYPTFAGKDEASVAIVGGGMTGALVAHAFASAGVATTLLEASRVGEGSTAASSALLLKEPDLELRQLADRYGMRTSRRIWQLSHESVHALMTLLRRLRITCDLQECDAIYFATDAQEVARLRREFDLRAKAGFDAEWLGPEDLLRSTGIAGRGAIRTRRSAQFDPYRGCLGLMAAAAAAGARIFERSEVHRIDANHTRVRLRTRRGVLEATRVVIATGYATSRFRPLAGRFRMYRTYVLATERMATAARKELGLTDVMIWDTERPYHYARWTPDHRLLLGGADRRIRPGQRRHQQFTQALSELRSYFDSRLPALASVKTQLAWEGMFAMTPDSLPYIGPHRRYPRHWFALGYGGNGMTFGCLAARLLLERWHGSRSNDDDLFAFDRLRRAS